MSHPDKHIIDQLLEKHALGICTQEERAILERWYAAFPVGKRALEDEAERKAVHTSMKAGIFDKISQEEGTVGAVRAQRPVRHMYWRAAAAAVVLIAAGALFYFFRAKPAPVAFAEVVAPAGKQVMHMELPDGSAVWLEPGSTLRYARQFGTESREVQVLDGQAFFAVAPGASQPFMVGTPEGIQTKVLGTEFSVKAYRGLKYVQVAVSAGKVQVSDNNAVLGVLEAGQQLTYEVGTHTATRGDLPTDDWRNGNQTLQNSSFAEVARILQNRYGVKLSYDTAMMAPYRFNLRIAGNTSLEETMEMLKELSGMTYTLSNGQVTVTGIQQ
ncbi:ferric-dicitrate binding protein FerR, regulates iron transport through sigma-19 [Chitinophaga eiseniae]|uniref:Ferric-dicitrate binding protein FerR, regulates iron transport through sigma-19 n=1 Tax=Chitinophaga eiseniae TaxID=634771 RepID=A0A1T4T784_9BACT|nr:FecR family protein [Chitinophaga eiseniae]SKA36028.1 ferric-dicitrate binding protein FerR, regulates iron transport through sigma-19 [Chitinophaga eiseniae]